MISLVITVLNEERTIGNLLNDISTQSKLPDEVIIVDGGSKDETPSIIKNIKIFPIPIRLINAKGANRSKGRNLGIMEAKNQIIAITDAGVLLDKDWLKNITFPLITDKRIDVVTGMTLSMANTFIQKCFSAIIVQNKKEISNRNLFTALYYKFIYRRRFSESLPSSRSIAFRKEIWEKANGYPEIIECSEDMLFNVRLKKAKANFKLVKDAFVFWSPKETVMSNLKYFYKNALWDGRAGIFYFRSFIKLIVYIAGGVLLYAGLFKDWTYLLFLYMGSVLYLAYPTVRAFKETKRIASLTLTPIIFLWKDLFQNIGFVSGLLIRTANIIKNLRT